MPAKPLIAPPQIYRQRTDPVAAPPPKVISNDPDDDGNVRVTFALPGLRRAIVTVPGARWLAGAHNRLGGELAAMIADLDLQTAARWDSLSE